MKKPNLLLLGASGTVANAFLHYLVRNRGILGRLVLLDCSRGLLSNRYLNHEVLDYTFVHDMVSIPARKKEYLALLKKHHIDIVIDLTDADSLPILYATDKAGVSYVNTALNDDERTVAELVFEIYPKKGRINHAAHILCTGMNPGVVNSWVKYGIAKHGKPESVTHFEYDTSMTYRKWEPLITWSVHEFLTETLKNPTGRMLGKDRLKAVRPNAIENMVPMESILAPILDLDAYPKGFLVLHEENLTIAQKYDVPSRFVYAIHMKTTDYLHRTYRRKKGVALKDLTLANNIDKPLQGSDTIGVLLDYKEKQVYFMNSAVNKTVIGTNATCQQVVTGIFAALFLLIMKSPPKGVHFTEDLDEAYLQYVFDNMRVEESIFKDGRLISHEPHIRVGKGKRLHIR